MMSPTRSVYELTDALLEWMSLTFEQFQEGTYHHYRQASALVQIVEASEKGSVPKFAALAAIRDYNLDHQTHFDYEAIRDLDSTFIFSDAGEWVAFTDCPKALLLGNYEEPEDAFARATDAVHFLLVWDVEQNCVVVYRSPHVEGREPLSEEVLFTKGEVKGEVPSYVLPPSVEASLHGLRPGEILESMNQEGRLNAR